MFLWRSVQVPLKSVSNLTRHYRNRLSAAETFESTDNRNAAGTTLTYCKIKLCVSQLTKQQEITLKNAYIWTSGWSSPLNLEKCYPDKSMCWKANHLTPCVYTVGGRWRLSRFSVRINMWLDAESHDHVAFHCHHGKNTGEREGGGTGGTAWLLDRIIFDSAVQGWCEG